MSANPRPTLIIFQGGAFSSPSALETLLVGAQHAATLDLLAAASESAAFERAILATDDDRLAETASAIFSDTPTPFPLVVEPSVTDGFHFGGTLRRICEAHALERVVYIGGGAMPLGKAGEMRDLATAVSGEGQCVVANNLYSADMAAFYPASALTKIELPPTDNDLAWRLHYRAGLPFAPMPRTLATQFDIDTPADLATLWQATDLRGAMGLTPTATGLTAGAFLSVVLATVPGAMPRLADNMRNVYEVMSTKRAQLLVAGRVSSWVWRRLEVNLPCQTRVFSEERGMQASGRDMRGEVRSLLGLLIDAKGLDGMVKALEQLCDAAVIDTRVLFAHRKLTVSRPDRFASDALLPYDVGDGWVRDLTAAAALANIPILLGGHSLISGGVWALSERVRNSMSG